MQPCSSSRSDEEYDVENADYIAEVLVSDVLTTQVGKQCVKVIYKYLKRNIDWILQKLDVCDVELGECQPLPGQNLKEINPTLLQLMFHIGNQTFDQLLTGSAKIDYNTWLQTPLSVMPDRAWHQVSQRYEFQSNTALNIHDTVMVAYISTEMKN